MTTISGKIGSLPPWTYALAAMASVQLGSAFSVGLIDEVGPAGTAWLRLSMGALIFLLVARPQRSALQRGNLPPLLILGLMTGLMTVAFLVAIQHIPLGTAVAIEFLGPLTVAGLRSESRRALIWPVLALSGVVLLTQPWHGETNLRGVAFAAFAAIGWGTYIVYTQRIGDRVEGLQSLAITVSIAAIAAATVGIPQAAAHLSPEILMRAAGLAMLLPVFPFALEMLALRRMTQSAFGTLMALEPGIGAIIGAVVLTQLPSIAQVVGVGLVIIAGAAAQRNRRQRPID